MQTECCVGMDSVSYRLRHCRQPRFDQVEDVIGEHLGAVGQVAQPWFGADIQGRDQFDGPCLALGPLPRRIRTEEFRLGERIL